MNDNRELEIYACIEGYTNYLITSYGRVISINDNKYNLQFKQKSTNYDKDGYEKVTLAKKHKPKVFSVHRLVAQAFIPNPDNKPQVNHIDENKTNNHIYNLEWTTAKENCNHGTHNERVSNAQKGSKNHRYGKQSTTRRKVVRIGFNSIKIYDCIKDAESDGFNHSQIISCCQRKYGYKTHKGYQWIYLEDYNKEEK